MPRRLIATPEAAGVDEAGRGPLAGPVVVAAVIIPAKLKLPDLDDSKKLDAATRERLDKVIRDRCAHAVAVIDHLEIDRINILQATLVGMTKAVEALGQIPILVYIDGNQMPKLPYPGQCVIDGDAKYRAIAAASVVAKTHRDALMKEMAITYPQYGFESHFGYATPVHRKALQEHGPCPIHRRSFKTVQELLQGAFAFLD